MSGLIVYSVLASVMVQEASVLEGKPWVFVQIEGWSVPMEGRRPTIEFMVEGGRIGGYSGVNTYGGTAKYKGQSLTLSEIFMTKMAGPPERMDLERRVTGVLDRVDGWRRTSDYLELTKDGMRVAKLYRSK